MRARKLPADERRTQILDAAVPVFARMGYAAAGTAEIAANAGIGEPTIYRYFANKRDLYLAAIDRTNEEISDRWQSIADEHDDPLLTLKLVGVWYYEQITVRPDLLLFLTRSHHESHEADVGERVRAGYMVLKDFVQRLYEQAQARGQVADGVNIETLTWFFLSVGALIDLTQMLGLSGELRLEHVTGMAQRIQLMSTTAAATARA